MDTNRLYVGLVVKNYKELCELLGEPVKSGNAKKYQLIDWERYFEYEKKGNKFVIRGIYDNTMDKVVKRGGSRVILPFMEDLEILLLDTLIRRQEGYLMMSKSKLMLELCMVNPVYNKYFGDREALATLMNVDLMYVIDFYDTTSATFKNAINTVTKRLESKKLVSHEQVYMIEYEDNRHGVFDYDSDTGGYSSQPKILHRQATDNEIDIIRQVERGIMKYKYNAESVQDLFKDNKLKQYHMDVNKQLNDQLGILRAYKAEKYRYDIDELIEQKVKLLKEYQVEEVKDNINVKVMTRIHDNSQRRYERAIDKLLETNELPRYRLSTVEEDYIDNTDTLSSVTIDRHNSDSLKNVNNDNSILNSMMDE